MTAYGEFSPTETQKEIARKAAMDRPRGAPSDFRWRFILPGQPEARVTWQPEIFDAELANGGIKTGLAWVETAPLMRTLGIDWMLRVEAQGEVFLVREGRFFRPV